MCTTTKSQKKILETISLLKDIINNADLFKSDKVLVNALKSQGALAKYQDTKRGILLCSLNTLKKASEVHLDRGFLELDELRNNAKEKIEKEVLGLKVTKSTQAGLKESIKQLEKQLDITQRSNFLLSTIIQEIREHLKRMSELNSSIELRQELYRRVNSEIEAKINYTLYGEL